MPEMSDWPTVLLSRCQFEYSVKGCNCREYPVPDLTVQPQGQKALEIALTETLEGGRVFWLHLLVNLADIQAGS